MNILALLDYLEDEIDKGMGVPFTGRHIIDKDKCLNIIKDVRLNLPDEMKQAELIKRERQSILADAQSEATTITQDAKNRINQLINENEITLKAQKLAEEIMTNAHKNATEIRIGAKEYADDILRQVEQYMQLNLHTIIQNRQELKGIAHKEKG